MKMANNKDMISSEEARIMLLEQKNDAFYQALNRIDKRFDSIDERFNKIDGELNEIKNKMEIEFKDVRSEFKDLRKEIKSDFRWTLTFIVGLAGIMAHGFHWI